MQNWGEGKQLLEVFEEALVHRGWKWVIRGSKVVWGGQLGEKGGSTLKFSPVEGGLGRPKRPNLKFLGLKLKC